MFKKFRSLGLAAGLFAATSAFAVPVVVNAGFELPVKAPGTKATGSAANGYGWVYTGQSGVASEGSSWFSPSDVHGSQSAFIYGYSSAAATSFGQSISGFEAGNYTLSFFAENLLDYGPAPFQVKLDGNILVFGMDTTIYPSAFLEEYVSNAIYLTAGTHQLDFVGIPVYEGYMGSFIDDVSFKNLDLPVAAIPEPSTYAFMLMGLVAIGASSNRRRQK